MADKIGKFRTAFSLHKFKCRNTLSVTAIIKPDTFQTKNQIFWKTIIQWRYIRKLSVTYMQPRLFLIQGVWFMPFFTRGFARPYLRWINHIVKSDKNILRFFLSKCDGTLTLSHDSNLTALSEVVFMCLGFHLAVSSPDGYIYHSLLKLMNAYKGSKQWPLEKLKQRPSLCFLYSQCTWVSGIWGKQNDTLIYVFDCSFAA